ncbi:MAG TPA: methyltransferase domain-containing protein [Pseudolabrys sp.]|nr:methyltransferase domain-containing protein [Pseudolabrys sp.]
MNRKQRRGARKQPPSSGSQRTATAGNPADQLFTEAEQLQRRHKLDDAIRLYKRLLLLKPDHAQANNNVALVLLAQGKRSEASAHFAQALTLMPQLFEQYNAVCDTLAAVLPPIGAAMQRALAARPNRLSADQLLAADDHAAVRADPLLRCMLEAVPARNIGLELVLTALRAAFTADASDENALSFCCALAKQCFINEYVFAVTAEEEAQVERLTAAIGDALSAGAGIAPMQLAVLAMYAPLHRLPFADALLTNAWPAPLEAVVTQQIREPRQEVALRPAIPRLTAIVDETSLRVQQQYEENPYPRGINLAGNVQPVSLDRHLRAKFPTAAFTPLAKSGPLDILVPGCGTGLGAQVAQMYDAHVLAVDLSLASLAYAKRTTPAALASRIEYVQGDILKLGAIGRTFDFIEVTGVLHHMADPLEGWRVLLALLQPGGIMHLGFYSELGRRDVVDARAFIAERGYAATPADIRRCRQDILQTPHASVARFTDFFSTSECRDLLFHVQESRMTIPAIKDFVDSHGLKFIGFDLDDATAQKYREAFAAQGWSMSDLAKWHAVEMANPDMFSGMFQLWVQRNG